MVQPPRLVDACLAVLVALIVLPASVGGQTEPATIGSRPGFAAVTWLLFAAVQLPLFWRRRAPVAVFWSILALVGLCVLLDVAGVFLVFAPLFALYGLARYARIIHVLPALVTVLTAVVVAILTSDGHLSTMIGVCSIVAVICLLAISLRLREKAELERIRHRQQELEAQARIAVTAERTLLAREVHDVVAHNLAVMVALADGAAATAGTDPNQATELMRQSSTTGRAALAEMRRMVGVLRDGQSLAPQPGIADLDDLVAQVRDAGLQVELSIEEPQGALSAGAGLIIYRIVQEGLTNTLKHAGPTAHASVHLRRTPTGIALDITDDGAHTTAPTPIPGGHGLLGITERATAYGGTIHAAPQTPTGWRLTAHLPLDPTTSTPPPTRTTPASVSATSTQPISATASRAPSTSSAAPAEREVTA
ncbi:signal transduction histidine kinase [Kribbella voronezhensis]|uniref:histidine kinase n=1 Tax=Kribbella voronezhensis TaxID=2512212 RepID=A0A4R7SXM9_9ACTN|nr:signal transduction histidine kinase [Kribbella voronezhensis]